MRVVYVAIEGPTGAGKTTLAERLALALDAIAVLDPFEANPFLTELLTSEQPAALALRVELTFFALRVAQLREIAGLLAAGGSVVADWALLKQPIFAAATLAPADVARIAATVDVWSGGLPLPDVLIGLSASAATLRSRVRQRGRDIEAGLTSADLSALATAFETAYAAWPRPLIRVDSTTFDVFDEQNVRKLAARGAPAPDLLGDTMTQPDLGTAKTAAAGPPCRRLLITDPGTVELIEQRLPPPGEHDVYARTVVSGISHGTEIAWLRGSAAALHRTWDASRRIYLDGPGRDFPVAPGYESIGRVTQVGPAVTAVKAGDLIAVDSPHADGHLLTETAACASAAGSPPSPPTTGTSPGCGSARSTTATASR